MGNKQKAKTKRAHPPSWSISPCGTAHQSRGRADGGGWLTVGSKSLALSWTLRSGRARGKGHEWEGTWY